MTSGCSINSFESPERRSSLLIAVEVSDSTISVHGELDCSSASLLLESVQAVLTHSDQTTQLTLSLRGVTFLDSYGVQSVADALAAARGSGRRVVVEPPADRVGRVFRLVGAAHVLDETAQFTFAPTTLNRIELLRPTTRGKHAAR